jgi:hypothetical protein
MAEMGEMPQMDRFDEVFSDLADDETMEEGKVGDFFRKVGSGIGGFDRGIEKGLQTPEGQELEKSFMESENEKDWFAKYSRVLVRATAPGGLFDTAASASTQTKDVVEYLRKKKADSKVAE